MHYREAFRSTQQAGLPISDFAIQTSDLNNRICYIIAELTGKGKVTFRHEDIAQSDAFAILKKIKATTEALTTPSSIHLVVDNTQYPIDAEEWGLGHPDSELLRRQAQ